MAIAPLAIACGSSGSAPSSVTALDGSIAAADAGAVDASAEAAWPLVDGGFATPDGGVLRADRFVTKVVSFLPGPCAGFGIPSLPGVVMGPPEGGGDDNGSLDVVSLGVGGEIVLSFEPNAIVDGPGVDFVVFENAFAIGGNPANPYAEPGEVSVSDDGVTWTTFPCTATKAPFGACAGWHSVYSSVASGISPFDPKISGGDPFDLADLGVTHARFVRIRDKSGETCPDAGAGRPTSDGFDLDAVAIVNAENP